MAGNSIRVNTDQVEQIANQIDKLNKELSEQLKESKATIDSLANIWQGEASQATIESFNEFANKYFQNYENVITDYVTFLKQNVAKGYFDTETHNVALADSFK